MKILVTGSAGFIGFHCVNRFAADGHDVVGIDNINEYYDVALKFSRLNASGIQQEKILEGVKIQSEKWPHYSFVKGDVSNPNFIDNIFSEDSPFDVIVHLAAQAGVRYSLVNPDAYIASNVIGFYNILESCRKYPVKHLIYASSSSVYGNSTKVPFVETDMTDDTVSLYAATKKKQRTFRLQLQPFVQDSNNGIAIFHRIWPLGQARYGLLWFCR